jgi:hypothetical protein
MGRIIDGSRDLVVTADTIFILGYVSVNIQLGFKYYALIATTQRPNWEMNIF